MAALCCVAGISLRRQIVSEQRAAGVAPDFEFTTFSADYLIQQLNTIRPDW